MLFQQTVYPFRSLISKKNEVGTHNTFDSDPIWAKRLQLSTSIWPNSCPLTLIHRAKNLGKKKSGKGGVDWKSERKKTLPRLVLFHMLFWTFSFCYNARLHDYNIWVTIFWCFSLKSLGNHSKVQPIFLVMKSNVYTIFLLNGTWVFKCKLGFINLFPLLFLVLQLWQKGNWKK